VGVPLLYPEGKGDRDSYVVWQEKVSPVIIVEFPAPNTEADDLGQFARKPPNPRIRLRPSSLFMNRF